MKAEEKLGILLNEQKLRITAAESFTGGLFSKTVTDVPGSSAYFLGSIISYSNYAKEHILNVPEEIIKKEGAVSERTALLMSKNAAKIFHSDVGVSFTGVAGPSSQEGKPVGLVYIGITLNKNTKVYEKHFLGNRAEIREKSVTFAIKEIIEMLGGK